MFDTLKEILHKVAKSRIFVLCVVMILLSSTLIGRLFYLQIIKGEEYQNNYSLKIQKPRILNGSRGNIYDRNGNLLAYNELANSVTIEDNGSYDKTSEKNEALNTELYNIIKELDKNGDVIENDFEIGLDDDGNYYYTVEGTTLKRFLADTYGHSSADDLVYNKKLKYNEAEATPKQVMDYLCRSSKQNGYDLSEDDYAREDLYRIVVLRCAIAENSYQKYISTTIAQNVSDETVAYITENMNALQGVDISEDTIRKYVDSEYFSHIIGYTGKISQEEYDELSADNDEYSLNDVIGKSGIEQVMDETLQGKKGSETVYVDSLGKVMETTERIEPQAGNDVYLSIDKDLQEAVYNLLEQEIAGILYSKIVNIKEYNTAAGTASDILIPIDDVYFALINNNVLDLNHFSAEDASDVEKQIFSAFGSKQQTVLSQVESSLSSSAATPVDELPEEMQDYMTYIPKMLVNNKILLTDSIDKSDETYKNYAGNKISVNEYLNYAISQKWIDITKFSVDEKYSDSSEIYDALVSYIVEELASDKGFSKIMYKYMIHDDLINGTQLCLALFDQKVLNYDDTAVSGLQSGSISAFNFIKEKVKNLEITPAQLALDPCSGSCVITDVKTGELLACVTYPGYDTNRLANTVDSNYYNLLYQDLSNPFYNNATQQTTAPGSTFKMVTASAGLTEGIISPGTTILDKGQFEEVANGPKCWIYPSSHGSINVSEALRDSCNYFFYKVGYDLSMVNGTYNEDHGVEMINKYSSMYGLDSKTGIEIAESKPKQTTEFPITSAIGQSNNSFTTVQLSRYVTAVANSGTVYNYTLLKQVTDSDGNVLETYEPTVKNTMDNISESTWDAIHSGIKMVVETHEQFDGLTVESAGKTGTAQQVPTRPNHALYVGYAPYNNPEISIATRIAYGYTSANTAELAASVYKYYFHLEDTSTLLDGQAEDVGAAANAFND